MSEKGEELILSGGPRQVSLDFLTELVPTSSSTEISIQSGRDTWGLSLTPSPTSRQPTVG